MVKNLQPLASAMRRIGYSLVCSALCICALLAQQGRSQNLTQIAPGVYRKGNDGKLHPATNVDVAALWPGVWKVSTNGLRVQLYCWHENSHDLWASVAVGSVVSNLLGEYVSPPGHKLAKVELRNAGGTVVAPIRRAGLEHQMPLQMALNDLPRWSDGSLQNVLGFFTNGPPAIIERFRIADVFRVKTQGFYTLNICATVYKFSTNKAYVTRTDLPCLSTNLYLLPSE